MAVGAWESALKEDTTCQWDKHVEIIPRDGIKMRADTFHPKEGGVVPALIVWNPYGKAAYRSGEIIVSRRASQY